MAHRYSAGPEAHILISVGIKDATELTQLTQRVEERGYDITDISGMEVAQVGT